MSIAFAMPGTAAAVPGPSGYRLIKKIKVGGQGFWDYLTFESATRRLFISHATKVQVLDVDTGQIIGEIPDTPGVHGITLARDLGRGYISNGAAARVTIFDLNTLKTISTVPTTGQNPDAIVYEPMTHRVFTFNGRSGNSTVIDARTGNVLGTIELGGRPEFAVADGRGAIYNNLEDKSDEVRIDAKGLKITARWPLAPCKFPSGLAMDRAHRRLFAGCENKMMAVVDADTGKVIATPPIGEGVDANRFDPGTEFAFSSNGRSGTLTVVHEDSPGKYTVVENAPTERGARTMALDVKTHEVFLVTAGFGPPPPPTPEHPHPYPTIVPDSFTVLIFGR